MNISIIGRFFGVTALSVLLFWVSIGTTLNMQGVSGALVWWPSGAETKAGIAGTLLSGDLTRAKARRAEELARAALIREPILIDAVRFMGLARAALNGEIAADPIFAYAEQLSRRDLGTELWLIQRYVDSGDINGALQHYDRALRTDPASFDLLMPVLISASNGDAVTRSMLPYLSERPDWSGIYLKRLAAVAVNPHTLFEQAEVMRLKPDNDADLLEPVISQLVALKQPRLARNLLGPSYAGHLRDPSFEIGGAYAPFDWWLRDDTDLSAYRNTEAAPDGSRVLRIVARAEMGGEVAHQLLVLDPGFYGLHGTAAVSTGSTGPLTISLTCDGRDSPLATLAITTTARPQRFVMPFDIPATCGSQWLRIFTPPAASVEGWLDGFSISRR